MALAANRARFLLQVAGSKEALRVFRFSGHEAISTPFQFAVEVVSTNPALDLDALLNCDTLLQIDTADAELSRPRLVHGTIRQVEQLATGKRWTHYRLHLAPKIYWLDLRFNVRIFQELTVAEIVKQLLEEAGLDSSLYRFELRRQYPRRTYCVQYNESELNFIQRLLAEEGIHYHFEHQEDRHVTVFGDHAESFRPLQPRDLAFRADALMLGEPVINTFRPRYAVSVDATSRTDYNFEKPQHSQLVSVEHQPDTKHEHYAWPGGYDNTGDGSRIAKDRLDQLRLDSHRVQGTGAIARLVAGAVFRLKQHARADFNHDWLILNLHHDAAQPQVLEEEAPDSEGSTYSNSFELMPAEQGFRPEQTVAKPRMIGIQTAVVVGPPGEQIYTDEHCRIQVRFHWDREGKNSCWLRLSQAWASNQWGSVVLPRVGQEVVVSFVNDDPDQPIVTGCLYHGLHKTPYPLPEHKSRSVLRSQSLAGKDGHELMLEDRAGQERIAIHSSRDFELHVTQDARASVDRHTHSHIAGDALSQVQGTQHETIQGERRSKIDGQDSLDVGQSLHLKAGTGIFKQAGREIHLKAGTSVSISGGMELSLKGGGSSISLNPAGVFLNGPMINLNSGGGGGSAAAASPKAPELPVKLGGKNAGQVAVQATSPKVIGADELEFQQLGNVTTLTATAAQAESEILRLLKHQAEAGTPKAGQLQPLLSMLNDAAKKAPDVGSILAMEGSENQGIFKRWSNSATGNLLFPTELTHTEEQSLLSKFRNLYGGNNTVQNALDIKTYNEKPLLGSESVNHGNLSDTAEIASLAAGIVSLLKYAPQFAAKVKKFGLDDLISNHKKDAPVSSYEFSYTIKELPPDLVQDERGVYGYLPTPESQFASTKWPVDWTDDGQVAAARAVRLDYHMGLASEKELVDSMRMQGIPDEDIAKHIVQLRNETRMSKYSKEELPVLYARNMEKYSNPYGPSYESLLQKYGSPQGVISAGTRSNKTMDILTGIGIVNEQ